mgnify:CR=1 FL=1
MRVIYLSVMIHLLSTAHAVAGSLEHKLHDEFLQNVQQTLQHLNKDVVLSELEKLAQTILIFQNLGGIVDSIEVNHQPCTHHTQRWFSISGRLSQEPLLGNPCKSNHNIDNKKIEYNIKYIGKFNEFAQQISYLRENQPSEISNFLEEIVFELGDIATKDGIDSKKLAKLKSKIDYFIVTERKKRISLIITLTTQLSLFPALPS